MPVIGASFLAGTLATFLSCQPNGVRNGIWAGIVSALVGSSFLIVLSIFKGERSAELLAVELLALLSFPPAVSLGFMGALVVAFARNPAALSSRPKLAPQSSSKRRNTLLRVVLGVSILCYLAPLLFLSRPQHAAGMKSEALVGMAAAPVPTPIPWHYENPAHFDSLSGTKIGLLAQKEIAGVDQNRPVAIAPDGRQFAFFTKDNRQTALEIFDLDAFQPIATFPVSHAFSELAWAPNSKRLFYVPAKEDEYVGVVDIGKCQLINLPIPKNKHVSDAVPHWWKETEVIFPGTGDILDLETLQLHPLKKASSWNALPQAERDLWLKAAPSSWVSPPKWSFEIVKRAMRYDFDSADSSEWTTQYDIAVADKDSAFSRVVASIDLRPGDRLLNASDGSKVIFVRENIARVFYMGEADSLTTFSVELPEKESTQGACLFVCPPVINPLNGKVVGPDRDRVKAIARVIGWKNGKATCWIEQEYEPVQIGDVAGDFHAWEDDRLKLIAMSWGKIEAAEASTVFPARSKVAPLENVSVMSLDTPHGVATVTGFHSKTRTPRTSSAPTSAGVPSDDAASGAEMVIRNFVRQHHTKSETNDVDGIVADYADRVEYFSDGIVDREFIRKDSARYHAPGYVVSGKVIGDITVEPLLGDQIYLVRYQLSFMRQNPNGKWMRGLASCELEIAWGAGGYRITKQHAKILNKEQSP